MKNHEMVYANSPSLPPQGRGPLTSQRVPLRYYFMTPILSQPTLKLF